MGHQRRLLTEQPVPGGDVVHVPDAERHRGAQLRGARLLAARVLDGMGAGRHVSSSDLRLRRRRLRLGPHRLPGRRPGRRWRRTADG
ncbi:hypothetical protein ACP4OV_025640 [Aristida adscensionis]